MMNTLIEPVELQESESNAQGWQADCMPEAVAPDESVADGVRVLAWTVDRICALPAGPVH